MPKLYVLSGPDVGRTHELSSGDVIGRAEDCQARVRHVSVSRHHARMEQVDGQWFVVDSGSRNGVKLDGKKVERAALVDGSEFALGELLLRFRVSGARTAPTPTPEPVQVPTPPKEPEPALEVEEIQLEFDDEIQPAAAVEETLMVEASVAKKPSPRAARARPAAVRSEAAAPEQDLRRSKGILQYQRVPDREGFFASDLAQQPTWVRLGVLLLALALFAALFFAAFKGTALLRERAQPDAVEAYEVEEG